MDNQLARQNSETSRTSQPSPKLSAAEQVASVWIVKFSRHFGQSVTPETTDIYLDALKDLHAQTLEDACEHCLRSCMFMPKIAEIISAYHGIVEENEHSTPQSANRNPAANCPHCGGDWKVMVEKFVRGKKYFFAIECPNAEQHRSDWADTHPTWHYELPKSLPPKLGDIR